MIFVHGMLAGDRWAAYARSRDRIKAAAEKLQPGLGDEFGRSTCAQIRARINEITGQFVANGPIVETTRELAEALEAHVKVKGAG